MEAFDDRQTRLVVTGHDAEGQSAVVRDEPVEPITLGLLAGLTFHRMWGTDRSPAVPADPEAWDAHAYFPPPGGVRFVMFTLTSGTDRVVDDVDFDAALTEMEERLPGMGAHFEPGDPGMHTTDSVDLGLVIAGRVVLELDDGQTVELGTGDCYVQHGTRHRWTNPSDEPATVVAVLLGTNRD